MCTLPPRAVSLQAFEPRVPHAALRRDNRVRRLSTVTVSQLFHGPATRSPLLKLSLGKGWGGKCTRSHVCCLGPVCGLRSAKDERLGTRWCTEPDAQSRMHFIIGPFFGTLFSIPYFLFRFSVSIASHLRTHPGRSRLQLQTINGTEHLRRGLRALTVTLARGNITPATHHTRRRRGWMHRLAVRLRHSRSNTSTECPAERL